MSLLIHLMKVQVLKVKLQKVLKVLKEIPEKVMTGQEVAAVVTVMVTVAADLQQEVVPLEVC